MLKESLDTRTNIEDYKIKIRLDVLFDNVKTLDELNNLKYILDDYLDEGYKLRKYIFRYNSIMREMCREE